MFLCDRYCATDPIIQQPLHSLCRYLYVFMKPLLVITHRSPIIADHSVDNVVAISSATAFFFLSGWLSVITAQFQRRRKYASGQIRQRRGGMMTKKPEAQLVTEVMETCFLVVYQAKGRRKRINVSLSSSLFPRKVCQVTAVQLKGFGFRCHVKDQEVRRSISKQTHGPHKCFSVYSQNSRQMHRWLIKWCQCRCDWTGGPRLLKED